MNKAFTNFTWEDYPSENTALEAERLNNINNSIDIMDDRVIKLDSSKLDVTTANTMVKDVTFNEATGVFTVTKLNGSTFTLDTKLEKLAVNFTFDKTAQILSIILDDGTVETVDLSAFVTQYEFLESDTIVLSVDSSGRVKATIKNGSITGDMLEPNYLSKVTEKADTATVKAEEAKNSATNAKTSESNAKTSETNAATSASTATTKASAAASSATSAATSATNASNSASTASTAATNASDSATSAANSAANAASSATSASNSATSASNSASTATSKANAAATSASNASSSEEMARQYSETWKGSLLPQGMITFAQLPTSGMIKGYMYCITNAYTTDSRFEEGSGYFYPAGTCVYWTDNNQWKCLSGVLSREITEAEYNALSEAEKKNGTIYYLSDADNTINGATSNSDGMMSKADKAKLDGIEAGANKTVVDTTLSSTSTNPLQNKAVVAQFSSVASSIADEIMRASAAETELATSIANEATRAKAAESANSTTIANHIADANNPHKVTKSQLGLGNVDNTSDVNKPVSTAQQTAINTAYSNAKAYTDNAITNLVGGAPSTLDTLKEIADAFNEHEEVAEALNEAIATKADQSDLTAHTGNTTVHITSTERTNWNDSNNKKHTHSNKSVLDGITSTLVTAWNNVTNKLDKSGDASNVTNSISTASSRTNLTTGEKLSVSLGKISKWFADLKTVALTGSYNDLTDKPTIGNGTVTIKQNGISKGTFALNQTGSATIELTDNNTTYSTASTSANGLMSSSDKSKLDGIEAGANCKFVETTLAAYKALSSPAANTIYFIKDA